MRGCHGKLRKLDEPERSTDQISAFDKLNNNSSFGTFRAGQAGDPRITQLAVKILF